MNYPKSLPKNPLSPDGFAFSWLLVFFRFSDLGPELLDSPFLFFEEGFLLGLELFRLWDFWESFLLEDLSSFSWRLSFLGLFSPGLRLSFLLRPSFRLFFRPSRWSFWARGWELFSEGLYWLRSSVKIAEFDGLISPIGAVCGVEELPFSNGFSLARCQRERILDFI